jgi:SAM-dependent methyltransferase
MSTQEISNVYADVQRADAYSKLEFPGTYYLAYRDLPAIITDHVTGTRALDFGCGTGRSTRFLKSLGFDAIGVDIAADMLKHACLKDPKGDYRLTEDGAIDQLQGQHYNLILAAFTFDNISTMEKKITLLSALGNLLASEGRMVNLVSSPEIYINEWISFTTKDFPENQYATSGSKVSIVMKDVDDQRPIEDVLWTDEAYREVYERAGLELVQSYRPLAKVSEPYKWINETTIAPWVIYVLKCNSAAR